HDLRSLGRGDLRFDRSRKVMGWRGERNARTDRRLHLQGQLPIGARGERRGGDRASVTGAVNVNRATRTMRHLLPAFSTCLLLATATPASSQLSFPLDSTTLLIDLVVDSDRVNMPWEIIWGPDDRLWMTDGPLITRWDPVTDVIDTLLDRGHGNG